ncbi:formylmethanofuran dehydrogenase subunit B [Azoarcus sp. KH32C]|uniref:formylmethanofuran dehydrogenase subunit B n=1 Tax=Azoarcus sp. KH32C TaxID=748247 RepID=UPI0002385DC7|nr:formylmethanofuran dehydrogenase subunit B [Azoarcus sp. KH32C]BAL27125.1 formylmethanofuran dehydrogenase, subunit B [Azoarcus sp. KH32C]
MTAKTASPTSDAPTGRPWTCPFCPLSCDGFSLADAPRPTLVDSDCPRATAALSHFAAVLASATARIDGRAADHRSAVAAAAAILAASRQPLFAGLATDVAGMRALYRLANGCGAILDHANGDALMHSTRALQDRGVFYTTLAEIRNRADLVVCLGTNASDHYPEFFRRTAPAADAPERHVVFVGANADTAAPGLGGVTVEEIGLAGNVFDTVALLAARLAGRRMASSDPALDALVARMLGARYTVVVWESGSLPAHGALVAETIQRIVNTLNRTTRAAAFCLGGGDGGYTANQVTTWLSGLPLRTGVHKRGLVHEPQRYATAQLLAHRAVDAVLWVSAFTPELAPPATDLPLVVLGHPGLEAATRANTVFIPVSTPGIGSAGHLFRADGGVVLPLAPIYEDTLPGVADVAGDIASRLAASEGGAR